MTEQQAAGSSAPDTRSRPLEPRPYAAAGPTRPDGPAPERSAPGSAEDPAATGTSAPPVVTTVPRPVPRTGTTDRAARSGGPTATARARRARLRLKRIDPWSVFVLSFVVSLFLAVVAIVAVVVLYTVLQAAGVPESINTSLAELTRKPGEGEPAPFLTATRAITVGVVIALVNVVLVTALATLSAVLYNLCAGFTGGLEVTLAEHDG